MVRRRDLSPVLRGFTIPEIVISMILLGAVLTMIVPLARRANEQGRASEARRAALQEVSNILERFTANPGEAPTVGEERVIPVSAVLAQRFKEPVLVVSGVHIDEPPGRRFDAALTWIEPTGGRSAPMRLSAFAFDEPVGGTTQ